MAKQKLSEQEILKKAIEKAIADGWQLEGSWGIKNAEDALQWVHDEYYQIIFNHDFAKALWGEEPEYTLETRDYAGNLTVDGETFRIKSWQYHLQQMVIAEVPIAYLERNI